MNLTINLYNRQQAKQALTAWGWTAKPQSLTRARICDRLTKG